MDDKTKQTLMNLKMFIAGDECLESSYSDVLEIEELIEKQQQEIEQYKDLLNKCDLVIKTKKHNMDNRDVYVVDVDDLKEALGNKR